MSDIAIRISNLSKSYTISHQTGHRATNLAEAAMQRLRKPFQKAETESFWALKDIDLEIKKGEVVGVIGRNGAGKSTLLKILSRITEPTTGRIELFGRVGSLLEVGTGFHPELTGRENIYLNGAILGMRRSEIKQQFSNIVDFAGVEKFLDTPVKRYSSGMYVRLAFSVAAHLNPEILIVDEVLAVGDAEFQKKCLGKMHDVAASGRTVLFVSHNMGAIQNLCSTALLIKAGGLEMIGLPADVVRRHLTSSNMSSKFERESSPDKTSIIRVTLHVHSDDSVDFDLIVWCPTPIAASVDLRVTDPYGYAVGFASLGALDPSSMIRLTEGENHVQFRLLTNVLADGDYIVSIDLTVPGICYLDRAEDCLSFSLNCRESAFALRRLPQEWCYGSCELQIQQTQIPV
ncbi:MAG: ABC transporter ATP-binding protein [Planctomycetota bacterium]|nr:ABC transporter ATP-binding protein [Planctomycetota bacterium]